MSIPSETLPGALKWTDELSVFIPVIDAEHQHLIQLISEFNEAIALGKGVEEIQKSLQAILDDAGAHFYHEETLFNEWGYPGKEDHAQKHKQALIELSHIMGGIQGGLESEWIETGLKVKRLLIEHLLTEDMKYRDYRLQNANSTA